MMRSRGQYLLFADADGATKFSDLEKLENQMRELTSEPEVISSYIAEVGIRPLTLNIDRGIIVFRKSQVSSLGPELT